MLHVQHPQIILDITGSLWAATNDTDNTNNRASASACLHLGCGALMRRYVEP